MGHHKWNLTPREPLEPPPKNMLKISSGVCPPPPPSWSSPSFPYLSYSLRFSGSDNTSYAIVIRLKTSGSPPLSGWFCTRHQRHTKLGKSGTRDAKHGTVRREKVDVCLQFFIVQLVPAAKRNERQSDSTNSAATSASHRRRASIVDSQPENACGFSHTPHRVDPH